MSINLPGEVMENIFSFMPRKDLDRMRMASTSLKQSIDYSMQFQYKEKTIYLFYEGYDEIVASDLYLKLEKVLSRDVFNIIPYGTTIDVRISGLLRVVNDIVDLDGPATFIFSWLTEEDEEREIYLQCSFERNVLNGVASLLYEDNYYSAFVLKHGLIVCGLEIASFLSVIKSSDDQSRYYTWMQVNEDLTPDLFLHSHPQLNPISPYLHKNHQVKEEDIISFVEAKRLYDTVIVLVDAKYDFTFKVTNEVDYNQRDIQSYDFFSFGIRKEGRKRYYGVSEWKKGEKGKKITKIQFAKLNYDEAKTLSVFNCVFFFNSKDELLFYTVTKKKDIFLYTG